MTEITIKLKDAGSVDELTQGAWGAILWLTDNGDGTYGLHGGGIPVGSAGEAYLRVALEESYRHHPDRVDQLPPIAQADPTLEVEEMMERIRAALGWEKP